MTYEIEQKLRPELTRNERLLWSGVPQPGLRWRSSDWFAVPFALLWSYMMMFGTARHGMNPDLSPLYLTPEGIPMVLVGLYLLVGRFFIDSFQRSRTYYGLTDQRIIIVNGLFNRQVKSLTLATLSDISLTERSDGSGVIAFGPGPSSSSRFSRAAWKGMNSQLGPSFDMIENARRVYGMIRDAQQSNKSQASF